MERKNLGISLVLAFTPGFARKDGKVDFRPLSPIDEIYRLKIFDCWLVTIAYQRSDIMKKSPIMNIAGDFKCVFLKS